MQPHHTHSVVICWLAAILLVASCSARDAPTVHDHYNQLRSGQFTDATPETTGSLGDGVTLRELPPIFFDFDTPQVPVGELEKIKTVVRYMENELRHFRIRVEGHADDRGSYDYNFGLGLERAANVAAVMVSLGIRPTRLQITSYGEEFPIDREGTVESRARNRRVEFVIVPPQAYN